MRFVDTTSSGCNSFRLVYYLIWRIICGYVQPQLL